MGKFCSIRFDISKWLTFAFECRCLKQRVKVKLKGLIDFIDLRKLKKVKNVGW